MLLEADVVVMSGEVAPATETNRAYALRYILDGIVSLRFEPGCMISELNLAKQLGLSRTPVREALIELSKCGIVEVQAKRATKVALIDPNVLEEAAFIRQALDSALIPILCAKADTFDFEKLNEMIREQQQIVDDAGKHQNLDVQFSAADNEFHRYMYEICGKRKGFETAFNLNIHFERFRYLTQYVSGNELVEEHKAILAAIRAQDIQKARDLSAKHVLRYKLDIGKVRKLYPNYFTPGA